MTATAPTTTRDVAPPATRRPLTGERFRSARTSSVARSTLRRPVLFFLGLTIVWIGVLWIVIFGSRPHVYLLLLVGIYLAGVLSGAGMSAIFCVRTAEPAAEAQSGKPVDSEARTLSSSHHVL